MIKWKSLSIVMLFISTISTGCGNSHSPHQPASSPSPEISPTSITSPTASPIEATTPSPSASTAPSEFDSYADTIAAMSLSEKVGQMVLVGLEGTTMSEQTKKLITHYHVGGFILYKNNITSVAQTVKLLNQLKATNNNQPAGLWLSVDQEGGKVNRMPDELTKTPTAASIGQTNNTAYTKAIGEAIGAELKAIGFNMDFAPVLDIHSNPDNPVIGDRSFGTKPERVTEHGLSMMESIRSNQVAAVVKHFPGHGDTSVDSHKQLPVIHKSLQELESFELIPFRQAVKEKADAVMIGHLLIPELDPVNPASLSKVMITNLLRESWNYDGVVITDDMTMGGISENFSIDQAAISSVLAGSDILLVGHDPKQQISLIEAIIKSVEEGQISEERLDESIRRILRLKASFRVKDTENRMPDVHSLNRHIEQALQIGTKG